LAVRDYRTDHHSAAEIAELILGGEPARLPELAHG
jgi:hypothetical protein